MASPEDIFKPEYRARQRRLAVIAFLIWAGIAALGFWLIPQIIDLVLRIYASFWGGDYRFFGQTYWAGTAIRTFLAVGLGAIYLAVVVGSAEYYYRNLGQPGSWTVFARIIAAELSIVAMTIII